MSLLFAILSGILQGATEFLPVSSSGHLALAYAILPDLSPGADALTFEVLLHLATLIVVIAAFRRTLAVLIPAGFRVLGDLLCLRFRFSEADPQEKKAFLLLLGTLPLAGAAFLSDKVEAFAACPKAVAGFLILNGILLFLADRVPSRGGTGVEPRPRHALVVGFCQLGAIFPGLSRSGSTITGGLLCGLSRRDAVEFSFLLSIPAILGAFLARIPELVSRPIPPSDLPACVCGMLAAGLTGALAIRLLTRLSKKSDFRIFSLYCAAVGLLILLFM